VEPIALRLRDIFGQENVFYDSWAIQPGDGIIDKMNNGLTQCKLFFFFVSNNSLNSEMVKSVLMMTINLVRDVKNSHIKNIQLQGY
jgi:hypothetical protein